MSDNNGSPRPGGQTVGQFFGDPGKWVPIVGVLGAVLAAYISMTTTISTQDQRIQNLQSTITDMKSQLIPKRVQTLEDAFSNMQQQNTAQFQAMQSSIQSIQAANQQSNQSLQSGIRDISNQVGSLSTNVTTLGVQVQYMLQGPSDGVGTKRK